MRFIYQKWDDELFKKLQELADLMAIFNYLLIRLNGDVDETFRIMEKLQKEGYIDTSYDLEEFKKKLKESKIVSLNKSGFKF